MPIERRLGRVEERGPEAQGHRATHHCDVEVEHVADRGNGTADELARALHDLVGGLGGRAAGDRLDGSARCLGFETSARPARTSAPVGFDDDVADVSGVARGAVEQLAVQDDTTADSGGHHHRKEVRLALSRTEPTLGHRQRLRIEVAEHR